MQTLAARMWTVTGQPPCLTSSIKPPPCGTLCSLLPTRCYRRVYSFAYCRIFSVHTNKGSEVLMPPKFPMCITACTGKKELLPFDTLTRQLGHRATCCRTRTSSIVVQHQTKRHLLSWEPGWLPLETDLVLGLHASGAPCCCGNGWPQQSVPPSHQQP